MVDIKRTWDKVLVPHDQTEAFVKSAKPIAVRTRQTIWVKDNSVTHGYSHYLMGKRKDNGKFFGRWKQGGMYVIRRTASGKVAFMTRTPKTTSGGIQGFAMLPALHGTDNEAHHFYRSALSDQLGIESVSDVYPAFKHFDRFGNNRLDAGTVYSLVEALTKAANEQEDVAGRDIFRAFNGKKTVQTPTERRVSRKVYAALHTDDPRQMTSLLTGHEYRKDIARALKGIDWTYLSAVGELSVVEPDLVAAIIENENTSARVDFKRRAILAQMFEEGNLTRHSYLRLLMEPGPAYFAYRDLRRMLNQQMTKSEARAYMRNRNVDTAHNELGEKAAILRNPEFSTTIVYPKHVAAVDGATVGKYTLALAKNGLEIQTWGSRMGHCIGSYAKSAYGGEVLGAVMQDGMMVANFHLRRMSMSSDDIQIYNLNQIFGKRNSIFTGATEVHDFLVDKKVILPSYEAAGMPMDGNWQHVGHMAAGNLNIDWGAREHLLGRRLVMPGGDRLQHPIVQNVAF